LSPVFLTHLAT